MIRRIRCALVLLACTVVLPLTGRCLASNAAPVALSIAAASVELAVPADYATIQAAIDAANEGDVVVVAPGVYREAIDLLGKTITVRASSGAANTTIDGSGFVDVVRFGPGSGARLEGFTLTSTTLEEFEKVIRVTQASPVVADCVLAESIYHQGYCPFLERGILIRVDGGAPRFERCVVRDNRFELPCSETVLLGLVLGSTAGVVDMVDCSIEDNVVVAVNPPHFLITAIGTLHLERCVIADSPNGGVEAAGELFTCESTRFERNSGRPALRLAGVDSFELSTTLIVDNADHGIFLFGDASGAIRRSTLSGNGGVGAAFDLAYETFPLLPWTGSVRVEESIVWGKGMAPNFPPERTTVRYCDVTGGSTGVGNFALDPKFVAPGLSPSGDYRLAPGSPCIDAGDPQSSLDPDGTRADVGALPYEAWTIVPTGSGGHWQASGALFPNSEFSVQLVAAPPRRAFLLVVGDSLLALPFPGFVLVAAPQVVLGPYVTDAVGSHRFDGRWPVASTSGTTLVLQASFSYDATGMSDGIVGVAP